jgi:hypothetical protein
MKKHEVCSEHGKKRKRSETLTGQPESKGRGLEGGDWIHLAQDMDRWPVLVNTVMKPACSVKSGKFIV